MDTAPFSSNNPFRSQRVTSTYSPFEEDTEFFHTPPSRTSSAQDQQRPFSFFQNDELNNTSSLSLPDDKSSNAFER